MWHHLLSGSTFCALCCGELLVCSRASIEASLDRKSDPWLGLHGWIANLALTRIPRPLLSLECCLFVLFDFENQRTYGRYGFLGFDK